MKKISTKIYGKFSKIIKIIKQFFIVIIQYREIKNSYPKRFELSLKDIWLCLRDATVFSGFDRHYLFHTAWASRVLAESKPKLHVDISSSLYFVVNASAFIPIDFYDYRPAQLDLSGLICKYADLTNLPFPNQSIQSLSCMHVVEHVGLGRYGEPISYDGDLRAISELKRVISMGGELLFVVPIGGTARIQFNAHRIYTYKQIINLFEGFDLIEFALICDEGGEGGLIRDANEELSKLQKYGCGCFRFKKKIK